MDDDSPRGKITRLYNTPPAPRYGGGMGPRRIPPVQCVSGAHIEWPADPLPSLQDIEDHAAAFARVWLDAFAVEPLWRVAWRMLTLRGCP